jgi:ABC-2 type transport system ATP-binding protein
VEVVEADEVHARLRVERDVDLAAIVDAARSAVELLSFAYAPPRLSEVFREAVAA